MEDNSNSYLYVVFSNTPCKMGSFIRSVTHGEFNHVSVALDPYLREMYSFARLKFDMPFCGGFVREGAERYRVRGSAADISVCAIYVGQENVQRVRKKIAFMEKHKSDYVYNMLSAVLAPLHKGVRVKNSYTCVEFVTQLLRIAGVQIKTTYSATETYNELKHMQLYRGEYPPSALIADENYADHVSLPMNFFKSAKQLGRLFVRLVWHKIL